MGSLRRPARDWTALPEHAWETPWNRERRYGSVISPVGGGDLRGGSAARQSSSLPAAARDPSLAVTHTRARRIGRNQAAWVRQDQNRTTRPAVRAGAGLLCILLGLCQAEIRLAAICMTEWNDYTRRSDLSVGAYGLMSKSYDVVSLPLSLGLIELRRLDSTRLWGTGGRPLPRVPSALLAASACRLAVWTPPV